MYTYEFFVTGHVYKANEAYSQAQRADPAYINSWIGQALIAEHMGVKDAMDLFRHATQLGYHNQAAVGYTYWVLKAILKSDNKKDVLHTYIIESMHAVYVAADVMTWYIGMFLLCLCLCQIMSTPDNSYKIS